MERVFNEYRSDSKRKANLGFGGVKMGDFGTGGRVYEREYTVARSTGTLEQSTQVRKGISFCCLGISVILLVVVERWLYLTAGCVQEAHAGAVTLPTPASDSAWDGSLVFTTTNPARPPLYSGSPLVDPLFASVSMPKRTGTFQRKTEYCQWREHRHKQQKHVGNEPDYWLRLVHHQKDAKMPGAQVDLSDLAEAHAAPFAGAQKSTRKKSGTHTIKLEASRINSLRFDNPAYHNPTGSRADKTFLRRGRGY